METVRRLDALVFVVLVAVVAPARAQVADHLECYKLKDLLKLSATADLESPQFGLDSGCSISKAKLFCVPATKTNVSVTNKATGLPIAPLPFATAPQAGDQICYKVKCPPRITPIADQSATDQFGNRTVSRLKGDMLCVPAVKGTSYCGDGTIDPGEQCEPIDLGGNTCTSLGFLPGTLACLPDCTLDTSGCPLFPPPGTCGNGTIEAGESCDAPDLGGAACASVGFPLGGVLGCTAWCAYDTSGCVSGFPATGQTTCWDGAGTLIPCAGTGQDGDVRAGSARSYLDNSDGTVIDRNTGLVWEKLSDDGSIHDKDNHYTWPNAFAVKIAALNTPPCFAGHCDWRLPNRRELESIVDLQHFDPCVSPAFNTGCAPGCTVFSCSCTSAPGYVPFWTSTSVVLQPISAWVIEFGTGNENFGFNKANNSEAVRAVRGGA
jgi:hypothetical protein